MKCPNCGAEVSEGDKFCGECGFQIRSKVRKKWRWLIYGGIIYFIFWAIYQIFCLIFLGEAALYWSFFFIIAILPSIVMIAIGYIIIISRGELKPEK